MGSQHTQDSVKFDNKTDLAEVHGRKQRFPEEALQIFPPASRWAGTHLIHFPPQHVADETAWAWEPWLEPVLGQFPSVVLTESPQPDSNRGGWAFHSTVCLGNGRVNRFFRVIWK